MYKIIEKLTARNEAPMDNSAATVVFLGDSVTNGCFEVDFDGERYLPVFDENHSYSAIFKRAIAMLYPASQLTVVNSGISGDSAWGGLQRLNRDVLAYHPDLVVICFGLNDCVAGIGGVTQYFENLTKIVSKIKESGADVIIMTPNDITNKVHYSLKTYREKEDAKMLAMLSKDGVFDAYMQAAREVSRNCGVTLVDCYAIWKSLEMQGVEVNGLLSNKINHPTRKMHYVFAYELLRRIFLDV